MTVFSVLGLSVMVLGYLVIGAVTFSLMESRHEDTDSSPTVMNSNDMLATLSTEVNTYIDDLREHTVSKLWQMTEQMNILYPVNWTHNAAEELLSFQRMLSRKLATEILSRPVYPHAKPRASDTFHHLPHDPTLDWGFARGFLYSLRLITTIGSGCDGPSSSVGCVVSIIYVMIGLPLMIIYLSKIGGLLANLITCFCCTRDNRARHGEGSSVSRPGYSSYSSYPGAESSLASLAIHQSSVSGEQERIIMTQVTPDQSIRGIDSSWSSVNTPGPASSQYSSISSSKSNIVCPLVSILLLFLSYITTSAAILSKLHSWSFLESFHFCFMSLLSVGTGSARLEQSNVILCSVFIIIGHIFIFTSAHILYSEVRRKQSKQYHHQRHRPEQTNHSTEKSKLGSSRENLTDGKRNNVFS